MSCLPFRSFKSCFLSYENGSIDNNEFSAFREEIMPKCPDFSYEDNRGFHSTDDESSVRSSAVRGNFTSGRRPLGSSSSVLKVPYGKKRTAKTRLPSLHFFFLNEIFCSTIKLAHTRIF